MTKREEDAVAEKKAADETGWKEVPWDAAQVEYAKIYFEESHQKRLAAEKAKMHDDRRFSHREMMRQREEKRKNIRGLLSEAMREGYNREEEEKILKMGVRMNNCTVVIQKHFRGKLARIKNGEFDQNAALNKVMGSITDLETDKQSATSRMSLAAKERAMREDQHKQAMMKAAFQRQQENENLDHAQVLSSVSANSTGPSGRLLLDTRMMPQHSANADPNPAPLVPREGANASPKINRHRGWAKIRQRAMLNTVIHHMSATDREPEPDSGQEQHSSPGRKNLWEAAAAGHGDEAVLTLSGETVEKTHGRHSTWSMLKLHMAARRALQPSDNAKIGRKMRAARREEEGAAGKIGRRRSRKSVSAAVTTLQPPPPHVRLRKVQVTIESGYGSSAYVAGRSSRTYERTLQGVTEMLMSREDMSRHTLLLGKQKKTRKQTSCGEKAFGGFLVWSGWNELVRISMLSKQFHRWTQYDALWEPNYIDVSPPPNRKEMRAMGQRGDELLVLDKPRKGWKAGVRNQVLKRVRRSGLSFASGLKNAEPSEMLEGLALSYEVIINGIRHDAVVETGLHNPSQMSHLLSVQMKGFTKVHWGPGGKGKFNNNSYGQLYEKRQEIPTIDVSDIETVRVISRSARIGWEKVVASFDRPIQWRGLHAGENDAVMYWVASDEHCTGSTVLVGAWGRRQGSTVFMYISLHAEDVFRSWRQLVSRVGIPQEMKIVPCEGPDFLDRYWGLYGYSCKVVVRTHDATLWHASFKSVKAMRAEVGRVNNTVQSTGAGHYRFWCIRPGAAKLKPQLHEPTTEQGKRVEVDATPWLGDDSLPALAWRAKPFSGAIKKVLAVDFELYDRFHRPVWWFSRPMKLNSPAVDSYGGFSMGLTANAGEDELAASKLRGFGVRHHGFVAGGHGRARFALEVQHTDEAHTKADGSAVRYQVVGCWFELSFEAIKNWYKHDVELRKARQADTKVRKQVMRLTGMKGLSCGNSDSEDDFKDF